MGSTSSVQNVHVQCCLRCISHAAPLYPLQDFKALYKYCIIIISNVVITLASCSTLLL